MILHDSLYVDHLLFILRVTGRGRVESLTAETDGLIIFVPFRILAGIPLPVVIVWAIVKANWFTYTSNETHVSPSPSLSFFVLFCFLFRRKPVVYNTGTPLAANFIGQHLIASYAAHTHTRLFRATTV